MSNRINSGILKRVGLLIALVSLFLPSTLVYANSSESDLPFYCPQEHVYVNCGDLYSNLDYYGYPKPKSHYYKINVYGPYVSKYLDECGRGKIIRKWKITYHYDTYWCEQTIHIKDPYDHFDPYKHIIWPKDHHAYSCGGSYHPDYMPHGYGWPKSNYSGCSKFGVKYSDDSYHYDPYTHGYSSYYGKKPCKVIYRKWELIDWCQYDEYSHYGATTKHYKKWYYTQKIFIYDDEDPIIESCPVNVEIKSGTCEAEKVYVKIPKLKAKDNCGDVFISYRKVLVYTNTNAGYSPSYGYGGSFYQGDDASGYYYPGTTEVTFKVWDKCGNTAECKFYVKVDFKDDVPPTPVAITSLTASLMQTGPNEGMIVIPAKAFNRSSYDNCTPADQLKFRIIPNTFTCEDFGRNDVAFVVEDHSGNTDTAFVEIIIGANSFECPGGNIAGSIMADANIPVPGVEVYLQPEMMGPTNSKGLYMFEHVPKGRMLDVVPFKNDHPNDRVDMYDFVILMLHIDGIRTIKDPLKLIAADIDNNKMIDYEDLYALHRIITGVDKEFSSNTSWRFVPSDFEFPSDVPVLEVDFPENHNIGLYYGGDMEIDFQAIKIGDLGSLPEISPDLAGNPVAVIGLEDQHVKRGEITSIPFSLNEPAQFSSAQFTIDYDPGNLILNEVTHGSLRDKGVLEIINSDSPGTLSFTWYSLVDRQFDPGEVLFEAVFTPISDGQLSESLIMDQEISQPKLLSQQMGEKSLSLQFDKNDWAGATLTQNYPNPFTDITTIGFYIPKGGMSNIRIESPSGKILFSREGIFEKGYHQIEISKDDIPYNGLMIYRLTGNDFTLSKKMLLIR